MRQLLGLFAALILTAPLVAHAQPRQGGGGRAQPPPTMPTSPTMPPLPPSVAPPITYPFAPLMPPPPGGLTPRVGEGPPFRTRDRRFWGAGSTGYGYLGYQEPEPFTRQGPPPAAATGLLQLAVTPASAQVLIDSFYVGTVEDVNAQRVLELEAGPHRVEFRAPQYQTLTVDVRILPLETVTYRGALEPCAGCTCASHRSADGDVRDSEVLRGKSPAAAKPPAVWMRRQAGPGAEPARDARAMMVG